MQFFSSPKMFPEHILIGLSWDNLMTFTTGIIFN